MDDRNVADPAGRPLALDLRSPRLLRALAYWQSKCRGRLMPSRADIDPLEMIEFLPNIILVDVLSDPRDYRYRVIGTAAAGIAARDWTGFRFSEIPGKGPGSVLWDIYDTAVTCRVPFSRSPPYVGPQKRLSDCENIVLPLSSRNDEVDMVLKVIDFTKG